MEGLRLYWLGGPAVELKGRPVKLETRKGAALLAYLSTGSRRYQREAIATIFWPEASQKKAFGNLRRTLSSLNSRLPGWIEADRETIGIKKTGKLWCDVAAFRELLARVKEFCSAGNELCEECRAAFEEALKLYRGDFLEGLSLGDTPEFDDWEMLQRDELRRELADVLQRLSLAYSHNQRWDEALQAALRWVALDRLYQPAHRMLMELYARSGRRSAALRQYEQLQHLLKQQPGEVEEETRRLYEEICGPRSAPPPADGSLHPALVSILKTKLYVPTAPASRVERVDLVDKLRQVDRRTLTVISAPAGFGKTTLLAEWIGQTGLPVAWLSLDDGDNDPYQFLAYTIAALQGIDEQIGVHALQLMQSPQIPPVRVILASVLNDLGKLAEPCVLALDDYQFITEQSVHESVAYLVEHAAASLHIVIASREDPPLRLGRLRVHEQLLEIRGRDLRFSLKETDAFLNAVMHLRLSPQNVSTLQARTEGWAVGLQMAAISLKGHQNPSEFIREFSGSHGYVLDYLLEEVMRRQPTRIQTFLLETSILQKLNGSLCDEVMSDEWRQSGESGQAVLEYLEKSNLFVLPLDDRKQWFRYHHLFADLLRSRLSLVSPGRSPIVYLQASKWFEGQNMIDEAVQYATVAKDFVRVMALVGKHAPAMVSTGRLTTILGWLRPLPDDLVKQNPWMSTLLAWGLVTRGEMERAEPYLLGAQKQIQGAALAGEGRRLLGTIATLLALTAENRGETQRTISMAALALQNLDKEEEVAVVTTKFALGRAYYLSGDFPRARQVCQEVLEECPRLRTNNGIASMASLLGAVLRAQGRLNQAETVYQAALRLMEEREVENCFVAGLIHLSHGEILRQRDQLESARTFIERGNELNQRWGVVSTTILGLFTRARLLMTVGDLAAARQSLIEAQGLASTVNVLSDIYSEFHACLGHLRLLEGDLQGAWHVLREDHVSAEDDLAFRRELSHILLARVLIAEQSPGAALNLLRRLEQAARSGERDGRLIEILNLQAIALQAQGKGDAAVPILREALSIAEPEGYARIFVDEGAPMRALLQQLAGSKASPTMRNYIGRLLAIAIPAIAAS